MMARYHRTLLGLLLLLLGSSAAVLMVKGIPLGIDFTGGTSLTVRIEANAPSQKITQDIAQYLTGEGFVAVEVRPHGDGRFEILWRSAPQLAEGESAGANVRSRLEQHLGTAVDIERLAEVGPMLGTELRAKALWAVAAVFLIILGYLAFAFRAIADPVSSWWYGIAALVALVHDVAIPVAVVALAAHAFGTAMDLLFVTAMLAIVGYSVNDTIVVFDRLRELLLELGDKAAKVPFAEVVDQALRASLMRSINTSLTTAVALAALVGWGAESTRWFAVTLFVGVVAGTISSLLFAPAILVEVAQRKQATAPHKA